MKTHAIATKPTFVKSLNGENFNADRIYSIKFVESAVDSDGNKNINCYSATIDDGAVFNYHNFSKEEIENKLDIKA